MSRQPIPDDALDDRLFFGGTAGSGKTYNAMSRVERLLKQRKRVVIPDPLGVWWGLRLSADGKQPSGYDVVIFGGPHGDLPLTEHAGALIGETVARMKESCILDLSQLGTKASERRFMLAFLTAFYKHTPGEPVHVIFDEADMWAPQKLFDKEGEAAKLLGMMETIVRRGRVKGFIPWLISQRPAVITKDILSQADGIVIFKLTSSQDRGAIEDWVEGQADKKTWQEISAQLPTMERGQGLIWLPGRGILETVQFPEKETFDSSRTPKRGERLKRTAALKPIDLGAVKDRLAAVESETKLNDPKTLRAELGKAQTEVTHLQKKLSAAEAKPAPAPKIDKETIDAAEKRGFEQAERKLKRAMNKAANTKVLEFLESMLAIFTPLGVSIKEAIDKARKEKIELDKPDFVSEVIVAPRPTAHVPRAIIPAARPTPVTRNTVTPSGGSLGKGERICLIAIAQYPNGVTREQLTVLTSYKRSTRDAYIQRIAASGFVGFSGSRVVATHEGIAALGSEYEPLPVGNALRERILSTLPLGERAVLEFVIQHYPNPVERDAITEATTYQRSTRDAYLQRLSARELVEAIGRGEVKASDNLFDQPGMAA